MTNAVAGAPVRLPHTGLRVPDHSLSLSVYREHSTSGGVAFSANLRVNSHVVGLVENQGHGGGTWLRADDWRAYGEQDLAEYAARCRSEDGQPVTVEDLLDALIDEHDWTRKVAAAGRRGAMVLRLMDHALSGDERLPDFPPYPQDATVVSSRVPWPLLVKRVLAEMPPGPHGWWQAWTGECWRDVTPRPTGVSTALYG